jgi:lipopolysaccharide/colanic/teichoic acid biosynthesis glycosyltransferase
LERPPVGPAPVWKRAVDISGAMLGMTLLAPLFLLVIVLIKATSRGPVFFKQQRIGYLGEPFTMWKFRTMEVDADTSRHEQYVAKFIDTDSTLLKLDTDSQLVPLGKWLRLLCIDELPQLINVLGGTMSLVGPRPDVVPYDQYHEWQKRRFDVAPGMTGLWQVSGKNRTTFTEMMRLDIDYAQRRSLALDLNILLMTVPTVLKQLYEA